MATASVLIQPKGPPRLVGHVYETLTVSNRADQIRAKEGTLARDNIRSIVLDRVLVDTGATTICLPAEMIELLGLEVHRTVALETAGGSIQARVYRDLDLEVLGREGTFTCMELPAGGRPLLGCIPLEELGLELDLANHRLRVLPDNGPDAYLMAYGARRQG